MHIAHCQPSRLNQEMGNLLNDMNTSHGTLSTQLTDMRMDHKDGTLKSDKLDQFLGTLLWFEQHFQLIWSRPDPATVKVPNQVPKTLYAKGTCRSNTIYSGNLCLCYIDIDGFGVSLIKPTFGEMGLATFGWFQPWRQSMLMMKMMGNNGYKNLLITTGRPQHARIYSQCSSICSFVSSDVLLPCLNPQIWKEPWVQDTQVECIYNAN